MRITSFLKIIKNTIFDYHWSLSPIHSLSSLATTVLIKTGNFCWAKLMLMNVEANKKPHFRGFRINSQGPVLCSNVGKANKFPSKGCKSQQLRGLKACY